jgi:hypothetical protein
VFSRTYVGRPTIIALVASVSIVCGVVWFALRLTVAGRLPLPATATHAAEECGPENSDAYYFPQGSFVPTDVESDVEARLWIGRYLRAMGVPPLSCGTVSAETYRLLIIVGPIQPASITFEEGRAPRLSGIMLELPMWQGPGRVAKETVVNLSNDQVSRLSTMLVNSKFWTEPSWRPSTGISEGSWILEGRQGAAYHLIQRPTFKESAFKDFSEALITLSGLNVAYVK